MTQRGRTVAALAGMILVLAGIVLAMIAAGSVRLLAPMPATWPIVVGAAGAVIGAALGARAHKAKSRVGVVLGLAVIFAMFGGAATALAERLLDVALDGAPEERHVCNVTKRWEEERSGRHGRKYDVYFVALEGCPSFPADPTRLSLPVADLRLTRVGRPIVLVTKPGYFGYPYLVRVEAVAQ